VLEQEQRHPKKLYYPRNRDLDPQLVWRGKDEQNWSDLVVYASPLYIQEKVQPKVLVDDLLRTTKEHEHESGELTPDLFADFNGVPKGVDKTEFYQHDQNWSNRMILGDSLQVMASLAEREGLRGKVQCIYVDPPYGIRFNSNFQWSTTSSDVKDGKADHITREPEQVKAFRDTWRDGIHSYLTYLRDRLTVARDLLSDSGSIFVQIGTENVHRVRAVMDEVFGEDNAVTEIVVKKKGSQKSSLMDPVNDFILWYSKAPRGYGITKFRTLYEERMLDAETIDEFSRAELSSGRVVNLKAYKSAEGEMLDFRAFPRRLEQEFPGARLFRPWPITNGGERANQMDPVVFRGVPIAPPKGNCWRHTSRPDGGGLTGMQRILCANRLVRSRSALDFVRYLNDFPFKSISNWWDGFGGAPDQVYVVQTNERIVERCVLMATDPGDLVLDPTCGSGTTATVAEHWGRRWITIDTSRVALALARV
jgi:adenine-specific DNA-methyltransferase